MHVLEFLSSSFVVFGNLNPLPNSVGGFSARRASPPKTGRRSSIPEMASSPLSRPATWRVVNNSSANVRCRRLSSLRQKFMVATKHRSPLPRLMQFTFRCRRWCARNGSSEQSEPANMCSGKNPALRTRQTCARCSPSAGNMACSSWTASCSCIIRASPWCGRCWMTQIALGRCVASCRSSASSATIPISQRTSACRVRSNPPAVSVISVVIASGSHCSR